jgi:hypothetical protein
MRRRQLVSLIFAGLAVLAPVVAAAPAVGEESSSTPAAVAITQTLRYPVLRDEAAMVVIGTALIALAGAVKRAA